MTTNYDGNWPKVKQGGTPRIGTDSTKRTDDKYGGRCLGVLCTPQSQVSVIIWTAGIEKSHVLKESSYIQEELRHPEAIR